MKVHAFEKIHEIYQKYRDKGFQEAEKTVDRISQEIGSLDLDISLRKSKGILLPHLMPVRLI
ncbi:MAG: hypothetical protein A3D13_06370 [Planctomycetes bacterium RIFCSPHIGHO2_02_FULL_40_12]|nr:MAG: hypothetical protein A3D13_06370 [Planctomycetes bacterium RIFCSPHIGHO2_02_FULL_40_12]